MPDVIYFALYLAAGFVLGFARVIVAECSDRDPQPPGLISDDMAVWACLMAVAWPIALPLDVAWCVVPWLARHMRDGAQRLFGGW